jgi:hypothetical protein
MELATINSETLEAIKRTEREIKERCGQEVILIAYKKEED